MVEITVIYTTCIPARDQICDNELFKKNYKFEKAFTSDLIYDFRPFIPLLAQRVLSFGTYGFFGEIGVGFHMSQNLGRSARAIWNAWENLSLLSKIFNCDSSHRRLLIIYLRKRRQNIHF